MVSDETKSSATGLALLVVSAVLLVIIGLIFFLVSLWIVKFAATDILDLTVSGDWIVLSAAILSGASLIGSKHRK